ncbi:MAG: aminopeptidase N [Cellvibrio sp.]
MNASMNVASSAPQTVYLKDYRVPDYLIDTTDLIIDIYDGYTLVTSMLGMRRNPAATEPATSLRLHGVDLELLSINLNGVDLADDAYRVDAESLTILNTPENMNLVIVTKIKPEKNTALEGLYRSRTMYCTQCEAEGFRKITYYLDRPDVMSEFTTKVIADKKFPVLLSNGNLIESGEIDQNRHYAYWHDPFKKPAYLFATVAGDLEHIEDKFITCSGREVTLKIFVEAKDLDKCDHAMSSLKNSMRWDEEVYGREYDLDIFMIVAVDDFNMGAMENKGLNIFNTSCVLAKPETTTDVGFQRVEGVVAHEYFHNWSGNRVTCRDWFQLSLKEGFTVYRDAEFSADMGSRTVKRIEDVALLRTMQFAEDAGPMAHPIRPESYIEISNFYTLTIYEKGAEIIRMLATLLGKENFRKGTDLYFDRHDGQAVTTDDFIKALEDASGRDLSQFKRWYSQAGTPKLVFSDQYDEESNTYRLIVSQSCPPTPESSQKLPFHLPISIGLLGDGGDLPLQLLGAEPNVESEDNTQLVLELTEATQEFIFTNVKEKPVPSLLRGFSAPVKWEYPYSRDDLLLLMRRDTDGFNRWEASQQLGLQEIRRAMKSFDPISLTCEYHLENDLVEAYRQVLEDPSLDPAMLAYMLTLPSEAYIAELSEVVDVKAIHYGRESVKMAMALALESSFKTIYEAYDHSQAYQANAAGIANRLLKNTSLSYLVLLGNETYLNMAYQQFSKANNMTDSFAGLSQLVNSAKAHELNLAPKALDEFYTRWQDESLVVNQWLSVQATCVLPDAVERVKSLMKHQAYDAKNPNKIRALIGGFSNANAVNFHLESGSGYTFLADQVIQLNRQNPSIAARLLIPLTKWKKYLPQNSELMRAQLERIKAEPDLSKDVFEVVTKSLA